MDKKNKIKTIYFDLDGTLFNENKTLTKASIKALNTLKLNQIRFSVATGRHFLMIKREIDIFKNNNLPFITMNGSVIFFQNQIIYEKTIDYYVAKKIIKILNDQNLDYYVYTNKSIYVSSFFGYHLTNMKINESLKQEWKYSFNLIDNWNNFIKKLSSEKIYKFLIIKENLEQISNFLHECIKNQCSLVQSQANTYDIFNKEANKGCALQFLADNNYINLDSCLVFGDGENDYEMFKVAGYSVAMKNAVVKLKEIANEITDSNKNDGVAKYVNKYWKSL